ncbi:MAG: amidase [Deltaproteobacteria bacterium]|nr:amidase [Deltaproteobacteria bacterium]
MSDADLAYASIGELGGKLRDRSLTSERLVEIYLERIGRIGPKLNAFITVTAEVARAEAKRADGELAAGRDRGPLHGIPYAAKDLVDTASIPTTWGCKATVGRVPTHDAAIVTRLREAGAVLLGKLSMTELANALGNNKQSTNHNGPCRNPWNLERWAGGSSSGSGAATAAGLCAFAIGSETWGSIDCPASYCGVTGYRPTFGIVSRDGALLICPTLDKLGPLARSAADTALVAGAIANQPLAKLGAPLRIGLAALPGGRTPAGYQATMVRAVEALSAAGAIIEPVALPKLPVEMTTLVILLGEVYGALAPLIHSGAVHDLYDEEPWEKKWRTYESHGMRADDYVKASYVRAVAQREYDALFARHDVLLCGGRPFEADVIDDRDTDVGDLGGWAVLQPAGNLIGAPGITLPAGLSDNGLPLSVHAMAAPYEDVRLFELGAMLQARTDHHTKRPPVE